MAKSFILNFLPFAIRQPWIVNDCSGDHSFFLTKVNSRSFSGAESCLVGLSSFKVDRSMEPEDWLISELATIDLHHGEFSHDPPWSQINVIGTRWTDRLKQELERFGFTKHCDTREGFQATRETANNSLAIAAALGS